ncbi:MULTISPECIES: hypothetical protein [unclassified Bradyrhizobium]|nr:MULTISPECIES: hypothetical protein [unclassified Bradyrhizobium]
MDCVEVAAWVVAAAVSELTELIDMGLSREEGSVWVMPDGD